MLKNRNQEAPTVRVLINGTDTHVPEGSSVAAALLSFSNAATRHTPLSGSPRAPYCLMGVCFDCLVTIDGIENQRGCQITVAEGMSIALQSVYRSIHDDA